MSPVKITITGAGGLLGWHAAARLHAVNCAARFRGEAVPYELALLSREAFDDADVLDAAVEGADTILHFAGVNRGDDAVVEAGNPAIAERLAGSIRTTKSRAHVVYANSTHARLDTPYGRSKRRAADILRDTAPLADLVLPHIFGECARPYYNNITATLIDQLWAGDRPTLKPDGRVSLLHAGEAARMATEAGLGKKTGTRPLPGRDMTVVALYDKLAGFHRDYQTNLFPDLGDDFDLALFNSYRTGGFPRHTPIRMKLNTDPRGWLFESAKSTAGSQTFLSTTRPGRTRGDHFHIGLVERFVVVAGKATIRVRKVMSDTVHTFEVAGDEPTAIDMPPLHTHHIENTSENDVVTFFWAHRLFDPAHPDTFADPVLGSPR